MAACAAAFMVAGAWPCEAQAEPRRVLLLYSYEREFSHFTFARLFRPELARSSPDPIDFVEFSIQTVRGSRTESDASTVDGVRGSLGTRPIDLVVTLGGPAANFALKYKGEVFPHTPVLLSALDSRFLADRAFPPDTTAVSMKNDPVLALDSLLRLSPEVRTVMVVIGASGLERFWLQEVQRQFRPFEDRVAFIWTNEMSTADLLRRSGSLPPQSAILYGIWALDAKGVPQMEDPTLDALHAAANAPMFGLHEHQLGHGIVGGPLLSLDDLSRDSAVVALRLLRGEAAGGIPPQTMTAATTIFDGRELRRWRIPERRLEHGSQIRFRDATSAQDARGPIVVAISVVGAQVLLMIALTRTGARRHGAAPMAPADLQAAEAALSKLSHRLMRAQEEERALIARAIHDDVAQQLAALTLSLHAIGEGAGRASDEMRAPIEDLCGQFWALERDILAISDPIYHRLTLLGLANSARTFCERRCAPAGAALDFRSEDVPADLDPGLALATFRVLEEAVGNALTHASPSRVDVSLMRTNGSLDLDVADDGRGFDVEGALRRGALGLVAMRERMRLVGGSLTIESRPGGGTRVRARVPVKTATAGTPS